MKKILWTGVGQVECIEDGNGPPTLESPSDVRIQVTAAGICRTDIHIIEGLVRFAEPPLLLGHEIAGIVDGCGSAVRRFSPGDRVTCDSVLGCGSCDWCRKGASQFCSKGSELGITCDGGWAEWLVVPERNLHPLPASVSDKAAAILDVEVFGALQKPGVLPGETVVVLGDGPAGLTALQLARVMGAEKTILCGPRPQRLRLGEDLGADHVIDVTNEDPVSVVRDLTGGRGADLAFEAAGSDETVAQIIEMLRPQGRAVFYGIHGRTVREIAIDQIVLKDLVLYGALSNRTGWEEMITLAAEKKLDLASLVTHTFPLDQAADAVSFVREQRDGVVKAVLEVAAPQKPSATLT